MQSFSHGQRVIVKEAERPSRNEPTEPRIPIHAIGTVRRVRSDGGAWVDLDQRSKVTAVHAWSAKDDRAKTVLAYPEYCELATKNSKDRRAKKKEEEREAVMETVSIQNFGKDHWSTFAYVETRNVDHRGVLAFPHLRCVAARHPLYDHGHDASDYPTRLKDGATISNHDDWDCIADLVAAGLLEDVGTMVNPLFTMTPFGTKVASALREWKTKGGSFATFVVPEEHVAAAASA